MSVYQGINQGIRTGLGIVNDIAQSQRQDKLDAERADDRKYQRSLAEAGQARQAKLDQRQEGLDALTLAGALDEQSRRYARAGAEGGLSPEDAATYQGLRKQATDARGRGMQALGYQQKLDEAHQTLSALKDDPGALDAMPAQQLGDAVSYAYGHPITDFIDRDGQLSPIGRDVAAVNEAFRTGNMSGLVQPINGLLRPEIEHGTGQQLANGDTIVRKQVSRILPHPDDPNHVLVGLNITAQKPDGSTYNYEAPMTKGRDGIGDDVLNVNVPKVIDRLHAYMQLHDALNADPSIAQKADEWAKAGGVDQWAQYRRDYILLGGNPRDLDKKQSTKDTDLGGYVERQTLDENGKVIKTEQLQKTPAPRDPVDDDLKRAQAQYYRDGGRGGRGGASGSPGGKRGEYLDIVGEALAPDEPDVNVRRRKALEYMKRDPLKAAQTMAAALMKADEFTVGPDKLTYQEALQRAIDMVQQQSQAVVSEPKPAAPGPATAPPAAPPAAPARNKDFSSLWSQ